MDYKKESGRRLKAIREARRLSLEELAQKTGNVLQKSRLGNYEQGTRMLGTYEALVLGRALDCDPAHLLVVDQTLNKQEQELVRNFRALPEKDRNDYVRRIVALALAYREPVPDEDIRLKGWSTKDEESPIPPPDPPPKKRQRVKKQ